MSNFDKNAIRAVIGQDATDEDIDAFGLVFHVFMDGFASGAGSVMMSAGGLPPHLAEAMAMSVSHYATHDPATVLSLMQLVQRRLVGGEDYREAASMAARSKDLN